MIVTQHAVRSAFEAILKTYTGGGDVVVETDPVYTPQANVPYVKGFISAYSRAPIGIGAPGTNAITAAYTINVNRMASEDTGTAGYVAGQIVLLLDRGTALALETGQVLTVMQAAEQPAIFSGDWVTLPVVVNCYGTE